MFIITAETEFDTIQVFNYPTKEKVTSAFKRLTTLPQTRITIFQVIEGETELLFIMS